MQRLRIVAPHEVEALLGHQAEVARIRSRAARRLRLARAHARGQRIELRDAIVAAAQAEAASTIAAAQAQADAMRSSCAAQLVEVMSDALGVVLRTEASATWVRTAVEDALARLGRVNVGELRIASAQVLAAQTALRELSHGDRLLPLTVFADDALASGTVVVVSDAGKVAVELETVMAPVRRALHARFDPVAPRADASIAP